MSENDTVSADRSDADDGSNPSGRIRRWLPHLPHLPDRKTLWRRLRWLLMRGVALLGAGIVFLLLLTAVSAWYTSRPEFCRSCHIMEPYFKSWQESSHSDVSCIDCHFKPGVGGKVRGKLLGLVQLAKYVTQSEGPRPAAEISDESCLRMGCHETRLLYGNVEFKGIRFDHKPHLESLRRGKKLRCTSCHSQIVQGKHMAVTTSTCFLCHFKDGLFNEGTGACTRCHQIPEEEFDLGGGIKFSHELAYKRGVDCANCHRDLIRGTGRVPAERCGVCHNRMDDLKRIDDHEFIHKTHVTDHKIECLDCHLEIQHSFDPDKMLHTASDCAGCHPDHHREQIDMLQGVGGKIIPHEAGSMIATRIDCRSCHRVKEASVTGTVLWKSSGKMCVMCHDASEVEQLIADQKERASSLSDVHDVIDRIGKALKSAKLDDNRKVAIKAQLSDLQHDLDFLQAGNGIHNIHYATTLTRTLREQISTLGRELKIEKAKAPKAKTPKTKTPPPNKKPEKE